MAAPSAALARRAVRMCPTLALRIEASNAERKQPTGGQGQLAAGGVRRR